MAIVISNSAPSEFLSTPVPLFRETKADRNLIKVSTRVGVRPASEVINLTLKNYQDEEMYSNHTDFKIIYKIDGDSFFNLRNLEQNEPLIGSSKSFSIEFTTEQLTSGEYENELHINVVATNQSSNLIEVIDTVLIEAELSIDAMDLTLSEPFLFVHHIKDSTPSWSASVEVTCNDVWTMLNSDSENHSALLINGSSEQHLSFAGNQTLVFEFSSDINELELGYHKMKVYFYQPSLVAELTIHIVISAGQDLLVTPDKLNFEAIRYISEAEHQYSHVYSSSITLSNVPPWLIVLQETFAYSFDYYRLNIQPIESQNLLPGVYKAQIKVTSGMDEQIINITHTVYGEWNVDYDKDVHFTRDNDILKLYSQSTEDTYAKLDATIKVYDYDGSVRQLNRKWSLTYLNNIAEINLGREIDDYLNLIKDPVKLVNSKFMPCYKPLSVKITVRETKFEDDTIVAMYNIPYQYFLRGRKPKYSISFFGDKFWANHNPNDTVRVTKNSVVELNVFKGLGAPEDVQVKRNGELYTVLTWSSDYNYAQPIFMNKRFLFSSIPNLEAGETIGFMYAGVQRNFVVLPEQKHSINIAWVSQFETLEMFEFTGEHSMPVEYESTLTETFVNWKSVSRKLNSEKVQTITINTGWIFKENIKIIDEIIDSKKAFLMLSLSNLVMNDSEQYIELIPVSKKLSGFDSKRSLYNFTVEFKINRKYEDTIYLR